MGSFHSRDSLVLVNLILSINKVNSRKRKEVCSRKIIVMFLSHNKWNIWITNKIKTIRNKMMINKSILKIYSIREDCKGKILSCPRRLKFIKMCPKCSIRDIRDSPLYKARVVRIKKNKFKSKKSNCCNFRPNIKGFCWNMNSNWEGSIPNNWRDTKNWNNKILIRRKIC